MGCFQSKKRQDVVNKCTMKNNNIMLHLRGRESGKKGSNGTRNFMENYMSEILQLYPDNVLYQNGPTYKTCIDAFRENVPVNSFGYEKVCGHFNWLRFDMEPMALFVNCHMNDLVGHLHLQTVNYSVEIGCEPLLLSGFIA